MNRMMPFLMIAIAFLSGVLLSEANGRKDYDPDLITKAYGYTFTERDITGEEILLCMIKIKHEEDIDIKILGRHDTNFHRIQKCIDEVSARYDG